MRTQPVDGQGSCVCVCVYVCVRACGACVRVFVVCLFIFACVFTCVYACMVVFMYVYVNLRVSVCYCSFVMSQTSDPVPVYQYPHTYAPMNACIRTHAFAHIHTHPSFIKFVYRRSGVFAPLVGQCVSAVKKANMTLGMIKRHIVSRDKDTIVRLYKSLVRPKLEYCIQA